MDRQEREYSEWATYDTNTQAYRANMIATQSLLLAVAAIFFDKNTILTTLVCVIGMICQWCIWFGVIFSRMKISDFHKFNAKFNFSEMVNDKGLPRKDGDEGLTEDIYVKNRKIRKNANFLLAEKTSQKKYRTNWRTTRRKLDIYIPVLFSVIWCAIVIFLWCA